MLEFFDYFFIVDVIEVVFRSKDVTVLKADTGQEALSLFERYTPSIVFIDIEKMNLFMSYLQISVKIKYQFL